MSGGAISRALEARGLRVVTTDVAGAERERAAVVLYERSLDRSARLLVDLARLGLDERKARVAEQDRMVLLAVVLALVQWIKDLMSQGEAPTDAQVRERVALEISARAES